MLGPSPNDLPFPAVSGVMIGPDFGLTCVLGFKRHEIVDYLYGACAWR